MTSLDKYDGEFNNSVTFSEETGYDARNAFSEFNYITSDEEVIVTAKLTATGVYRYLSIFEDGVYLSSTLITSEVEKRIPLSSGTKTVTIVDNGVAWADPTYLGLYLTSIKCGNFTRVSEGTLSERLAFLGDSITMGAVSTVPSRDSYARMFKVQDDRETAILGCDGDRLRFHAETAPLITETVSNITRLFSNVTTSKILVIALGANDYKYGYSAATYKGWYEDLVDAVNTADSDIDIYCLSPLYQDAETSVLDDYRTAVDELCTARAFCTHIAGKAILTYPTHYADAVHPNDLGNQVLHDAIDLII